MEKTLKHKQVKAGHSQIITTTVTTYMSNLIFYDFLDLFGENIFQILILLVKQQQ